uniref:Uncharacterized protein n=1 Tax=Physcomitrium patens TaxID=3218 RepID=A0A7I4D5V8_PHYPA
MKKQSDLPSALLLFGVDSELVMTLYNSNWKEAGPRLGHQASSAFGIDKVSVCATVEPVACVPAAQVRVVRKQVLGASERRRIVLLGMQMRQAIKLNVHPDSSPYLRHRHPATQRGPQS